MSGWGKLNKLPIGLISVCKTRPIRECQEIEHQDIQQGDNHKNRHPRRVSGLFIYLREGQDNKEIPYDNKKGNEYYSL
jgi:hypothetical protein